MSKRAANRAQFPFAAAAVDLFRDLFGDGVKLMYAREGGREIGKALTESSYYVVTGAMMCLNPNPEIIKQQAAIYEK